MRVDRRPLRPATVTTSVRPLIPSRPSIVKMSRTMSRLCCRANGASSFSLKAMPLPGFYKHGSARMERGTILLCIFSIFIFVQDVPYYNHATGSQASMIIGKPLALISLRGVVSSQRLHGVVIDTTLLATGRSYGKIPALPSRGVVISSRMNGVFLPAIWITCSAYHRKQEQRPVLSGLPADNLLSSSS